jgi:hypothetical protein
MRPITLGGPSLMKKHMARGRLTMEGAMCTLIHSRSTPQEQ